MQRIRLGMRPVHRLGALVLLAVGSAMTVAEALGTPADTEETPAPVAVLEIEGPIGPAVSDYISRGLAQAKRQGSPLAVIRIDTPGGLDTSMREIIRAILNEGIPVATYVNPSGARAASAGTYILYASHVAAMTPGTTLGAATPVQLGGGFPFGREEPPRDDKAKGKDKTSPRRVAPDDPMTAKVVNDAAAYIQGFAKLRGRNAEWAERAVRQAASLPADEALKAGVIDFVANDIPDLLAQAEGRQVRVGQRDVTLHVASARLARIEPDWRTDFLTTITNPNVALILMMIGIYGLLLEFSNPGAVLPGTIGGISLLLALYALHVLPVNFAGLGLVLLGVALMIAEVFIPSFGILGLGGVAAFILGAMLLFDTDVPGVELSWSVVVATAVVSGLLLLLVLRMIVRTHRRRPVSGRDDFLGARARVLDWNGRTGRVMVRGEIWRATADTELEPDQTVSVTGSKGLQVQVTPSEQQGTER